VLIFWLLKSSYNIDTWFVVQGVAVNRGLVFRIFSPDLDGHGVGGLGGQGHLRGVWGSIDDELVGNL
jgi:hypothetical protein